MVGRVGDQSGAIAFKVTVDASGNVTLDQVRAIVHSPNTGPDQATGLSAADLVKLVATITDKDGDASSATLNLGNAISFRDDAPTISAGQAQVGSLQVDETNLALNATTNYSGAFTGNYGADGAGSIGYSLEVKAPGADSGLKDTASGSDIKLYLEGGEVVAVSAPPPVPSPSRSRWMPPATSPSTKCVPSCIRPTPGRTRPPASPPRTW